MKKPFPLNRQYPNKRCIFYFEDSLSTGAKDFRGSYDTVKLLLHLCVGKCLDLFFALDSSSTGSDVPAPSLSLGEESPSCGNGKSSQRPTRVTHLSKSLPDTQILKFPNTMTKRI